MKNGNSEGKYNLSRSKKGIFFPHIHAGIVHANFAWLFKLLTYTRTVDQASFLLEKGGSWDGEKAKKDGGIARGEKPLAFLFPVLARVRW